MHDGQNLFDPDTSFAGSWGMIGVLRDLAREGVEVIVAGVANTGPFRRYEYSPFRDPKHGGGDGDRYLSFIIDQVIPARRINLPGRHDGRVPRPSRAPRWADW